MVKYTIIESEKMISSKNHIINKYYANVLLIALVVLVTSCSGGEQDSLTADNIKGWETRITLPPELFKGPARESYRIAQEIPEIIDSIYCYCHCKKNFSHKSLLTCHVDKHSAYCDICIKETLHAAKLHGEGMKPLQIRRAIDKKFYRS